MNCPLEVADVLLDLIDRGIHESRSAARAADDAWITREADHLYNLTHLLHDYTNDLLHFYWEVERPAHERQLDAVRLAEWQPLWERLRPFAKSRARERDALFTGYEIGTVD